MLYYLLFFGNALNQDNCSAHRILVHIPGSNSSLRLSARVTNHGSPNQGKQRRVVAKCVGMFPLKRIREEEMECIETVPHQQVL